MGLACGRWNACQGRKSRRENNGFYLLLKKLNRHLGSSTANKNKDELGGLEFISDKHLLF